MLAAEPVVSWNEATSGATAPCQIGRLFHDRSAGVKGKFVDSIYHYNKISMHSSLNDESNLFSVFTRLMIVKHKNMDRSFAMYGCSERNYLWT